MAEFIKKQVEIDRQRKGDDFFEKPQFTELKRSENEEKIQIGLSLNQAASSNQPTKLTKNIFKSHKSDSGSSEKTSKEKRKATSAMEEIMQQELNEKKKNLEKTPVEKPWLFKGIMVKIIAKSLGEKYYKQKGYIKELVDPFTAIVVTNSGAKIKLDQNHLETVIPAKGRKVVILRSKLKGQEAFLKDILVDDFNADLELVESGDVITLPYEDFSKKREL